MAGDRPSLSNATAIGTRVMISFKGAQFPKEVILFAVFFCLRYTVSYRDLKEIMAKRSLVVDHATLTR
jgi:putative transposase